MSDTTQAAHPDICGCCETELPEPVHENRPGLSEIDYRIGTHATFLRRMLARLAKEEIPEGAHAGDRPLADLTTRSTEDPAVAVLDAWATTADVLTFYQERIANEGFLRTATERRSVLELARSIGYELNPGVAASTYLAFTLDDAESSPDTATIPPGTQVQSIPAGQGELPQTFETSEAFEARIDWNALKPRTTEPDIIEAGTQQLYLAGVDTQLKPGDAILIVGPEHESDAPGSKRWELRILQTVIPVPEANYTLVAWEEGLGHEVGDAVVTPPAASAAADVYVFRQRLALFGHNAPDWRVMSQEVREAYCTDESEAVNSSCVTGKEWPAFDLDPSADQLHIDRDHPEIVAPTWIALSDEDDVELYQVTEVVPSSQTNFALTAKTTLVTLDTTENLDQFSRRTAVVMAVPEELTRAEKPLETKVENNTIELDRLVEGLEESQPIIVSGKLDEDDDEVVNEVMFVESTVDQEGFTAIHLEGDGLENAYVRSSVKIYVNVVPATHGETVAGEVLGSGDGSQPHQRFKLKKPPLTYVSAANPSGAESTLEVRINDVLWAEAPTLYGLSQSAEKYTVRINDAAEATVIFGDGEQGVRLPTGQENVTATYRSGIGSEGEVGAGSLTLFKTRPFGVRSVTNPVPAIGAADPEKLENARTNAPLTVLTLDRIVSLQDFEDFTRAFTGIGKAQAANVWNGETYVVHITIADDDGDPVPDASDLYQKLEAAIDDARDPTAEVQIDSYERLTFNLAATVQRDARYLSEDVQAAIETALLEAFSFEQRTFGQPATAAEIMQVMHQVEGVVAVDLNALYSVEPETGTLITIGIIDGLRRPGFSLPDIGGRLNPVPLPGIDIRQLVLPDRPKLAAVLPAQIARLEDDEVKPAQLLLIDEEGIDLTLQEA